MQLNSCNSNSCNSKDHLNRTNSSVPSEFTSKPSQENSFNLNSHNSKNHLNRTCLCNVILQNPVVLPRF